MRQDLGKLLLENGQITAEALERAAKEAGETGEPLGRVLLRLGLVNEDNIQTVLELHYAVNYLNLKKIAPDPGLVNLIPQELMLLYQLVPSSKEGSRLTIAMVHPSDIEALAKVKSFLTGFQIRTVVCSDDGFQDFIARSVNKEDTLVSETAEANVPPGDLASIEGAGAALLLDEEEGDVYQDRAIVLLSNHILSSAIARGCTNIHIEPGERHILVHYRKEGVLFSARKLPRPILPELIARFKSLSSAGNTQQSLPYDGRLSVRHAGRSFFFRLSIIPGAYGEHLVIWLE